MLDRVRAGWIGVVVLTATAAMAAEPTTLPFKASFPGTELDLGWTIRQSQGNTLKVDGGWLRIEAFENSLGHIERPITTDADCVTLSARTTQCPTIYLVWDDARWISLGSIAPTPFGRACSIIDTGASAVESLHRGYDINGQRYLRIQLGNDCVRFQYSGDGKSWRNLKCADRPPELAGPPKLIALGKRYEPGQKPFGENGVAPAGERGGRVAAVVSDIRIEPTSAGEQTMTSAERETIANAGVDRVSKAVLAGEDDPTFDSIARFYPAFKYAREAVGVPDHPLDIGVNTAGEIQTGVWEAPIAVVEIDDKPFASTDAIVERRLLDGYIPVLTLKTVQDGVRLEETVFGWAEGMSPDKDLIAFVRVHATAREGAKRPTRLSLLRRDGKRSTFDMVASGARTSEACVSFKFPNPAAAVTIGSDDFEQQLSRVAAYWREQIKKTERFDIPDQRVREAYRAWIAYSMIDTDKIKGFMEPHDGSGFYEDIFGISVGTHSMAMDQFGLPDRAQRALETLLHFQQPDGLYTQNAGLPDHGAMIVSLVRHWQMTGDLEFLKKAAPQIVRAGDWIIKKRQAAPKDGLTRGMIKFRPYCDYPDAVYNYFGDSWCCMGLESATEGLRAIGNTADADRFAAEAKQYRQDLMSSMQSAAFRDGDMTLLPLEPETHRLLKLGRNRGGDYWGLTASSLLENDFLPANDERAIWITDMLEKRGGLIAGICEFMEGVDHAYTYGYLLTQLKRDNPRKAILGFYSMLAFGMTRDTYSPVEVTAIDTGENQATLPHLYSCTEQLRLLRNLILREEGNTLWIGQAIPREWLQVGKHVAVNDASTTFGPVSVTITPQDDSTMQVHLAPPTRQAPKEIRLRLRDPKHRDIVDVQPPVQFSSETIVLKNPSQPVDLQVRFGKKISR